MDSCVGFPPEGAGLTRLTDMGSTLPTGGVETMSVSLARRLDLTLVENCSLAAHNVAVVDSGERCALFRRWWTPLVEMLVDVVRFGGWGGPWWRLNLRDR